jgi:hypothetical protein
MSERYTSNDHQIQDPNEAYDMAHAMKSLLDEHFHFHAYFATARDEGDAKHMSDAAEAANNALRDAEYAAEFVSEKYDAQCELEDLRIEYPNNKLKMLLGETSLLIREAGIVKSIPFEELPGVEQLKLLRKAQATQNIIDSVARFGEGSSFNVLQNNAPGAVDAIRTSIESNSKIIADADYDLYCLEGLYGNITDLNPVQ